MRIRVAVLGAVALFGSLALPASAGSPGPAVVRVSGAPGTVVHVALPAGASFSNGGGDTSISAPGTEWAGVALMRVGRNEPVPPTYYRVELGEGLLCPGRSCAPHPAHQPTGGNGFATNGKIKLPAGTYAVVLLGAQRREVSVTMRLNTGGTGTRTVRATELVREYAAESFTPGAAGTNARGFVGKMSPRKKASLQILAVASSTETVGTFSYHVCLTKGGSTQFDVSPGATAPCRDFSGSDFFDDNAVPPRPSATGMMTAIGWHTLQGWIYPEARMGVGMEAHGSGVNFRVVGLGIVLAL